jgi:hypothetical protein
LNLLLYRTFSGIGRRKTLWLEERVQRLVDSDQGSSLIPVGEDLEVQATPVSRLQEEVSWETIAQEQASLSEEAIYSLQSLKPDSWTVKAAEVSHLYSYWNSHSLFSPSWLV